MGEDFGWNVVVWSNIMNSNKGRHVIVFEKKKKQQKGKVDNTTKYERKRVKQRSRD